ncbi:MAG TPA: hypothetical protein VGE45_02745 [Chloroflexia bacterium]|jgi:hypothetical protein
MPNKIAGGERQSRRWDDAKAYINGEIDVEEYEARQHLEETNYETVMMTLARDSQQSPKSSQRSIRLDFS